MKNMNDVRFMLSALITDLRENKTTPANANAVVNATNSLLRTVKLELEYAKLVNRTPTCDFVQLEEVTLNGAPAPKMEKARA